MRKNFDLQYFDKDEPIATWSFPKSWLPGLGDILAVVFEGKRRPMRVIGWMPAEMESENSKIILDFLEK